ncbi:MAG: phosphoribosyltransferase [Methanomicrobiales archaeon]|nr:phosphoribosyltransferase [Methanomicrobiales archaeon]
MGFISEDEQLRDRTGVFRNRNDAGEQLSLFLRTHCTLENSVICSIPAGGIPIGVILALALDARLMLAVVRKIQIPWNTESGFGAVTWDGHTLINEDLVRKLHLSRAEISEATESAKANVNERIRKFSGSLTIPQITGRTVVLTDDGLASGYTMRAACIALLRQNPSTLMVAVPTGSSSAVQLVAEVVDNLICLNIRSGSSFAVADAYRSWHDLTDDEVHAQLEQVVNAGLF